MLWAEQLARGTDFSTYSERDIEQLKNDPNSEIVFLDGELEYLVSSVFMMTSYIYSNGMAVSFHYDHLKDNIKWAGLSKKLWTNVLIRMFNVYIANKN